MNKIIYFIISFFISFTLILTWQYIFPSNNDYLVAVTESLNKANEIQEFLLTPTRPTRLAIVSEDKKHPQSYAIFVNKLSRKQNRLVTHQLLNSDIFDESVKLALGIKHTNNLLKNA